jgi:eukaryotic-like serine/threonine-protein kinase
MDTGLSMPVGLLLGGRYHVGSQIARGGMATVYVGTDTRLDRVVAIKIAHPELADDAEFVRRFIGEARSAARLNSPNVVGIYDQGSQGRLHFIAMEYVPGQTLRQVLNERGRLPVREALDVMSGVLSGLAAAHQAGLAHRDVKPENVLLTQNGGVKVADFGLARSVAGAVQTKGGMIIGTAAYLAPEQVAGGQSDARTDVYAAGIMLYELLTGSQPHTAESPLAVAYKHVHEVVRPPSSVRSGLPPAMDHLVAMATSRDPDLRPANASQFLRAIDEVRAGHPVPRTTPYDDPYAIGAGPVGASALPSLGPDASAEHQHKTIVVPGGLAADAAGDFDGGPSVRLYDHRYQPRRARRMPAEPWWRQWLFGRRFVYLSVVLVLALAAGLLTWWLRSGQYTTIPPVRGVLASTARAELRNLGLSGKLGDPVHSNLPKGEVVRTSPPIGAHVTGGSVVTLIVSLGPLMIQVPNVSGQPLAQAEAALKQAKLTVGTITKQTSSTVPAGDVIATTPTAYTNWPQNKPVGITVSEGLGLPNLVGMQFPQAQQVAEQYHFTLNQLPVNSTQPPNTIVRQSPAANTPITPTEVVTVYVSQGPPSVAVPNVDGLTIRAAIRTLRKAGFGVTVDHFFKFGQTICDYNPKGNQPQGTTIMIQVCTFPGQ